jgi:hypothetical protein
MHHKYSAPSKVGDKQRKKTQTPDEMCYMDKHGVYLPADNLRMMLIGNQFRKGAASILGTAIESKKGTMYTDFCKACVWVVGEIDPLKIYYIPNRKTYDVTDIRSFVTSQGGRDVTERPIINLPWSLEFLVQITEEQPPIDSAKVREFFEVAGLRCGASAYGPTFGRFMVKKWDAIET